MSQTHSKRWQKALQTEREQRIRLEETLEQLAKQHNHLERAFRGATVLPPSLSNPNLSIKSKALVLDFFLLSLLAEILHSLNGWKLKVQKQIHFIENHNSLSWEFRID